MLNKNPLNLRAFCYYDTNLNFTFRNDILSRLSHFFIMSGANDYKKKYLSKNRLSNLIWLSNILENKIQNQIPVNKNTITNFICMFMNEQISYQKPIKKIISRNYHLYHDKYETKFKEYIGLTIQKYFNIGLFMLVYSYTKHPLFTIDDIINDINEFKKLHNQKTINISEDEIIKFVNHLSIDYSKYREIDAECKNKNYFPMQEKPLIKTSKNNKCAYINVSPIFFTEKVFNGIYFDIQKSFGKKSNFRSDFGKTFENYVGKYIKENSTNVQIFDEIDLKYIKNKKEAYFTDWTILEKDTAYIIEVKSINIPLKDIYNSNLNSYIETHIINAYKQIIGKIYDIDNYKELSLLKAYKIIPIIIFKDVIPTYNSIFGKAIDCCYEKNKNNDKIIKIKEYLKNNRIFTMNIDEFEYYWQCRNQIGINSLFCELENNNGESITSLLCEKYHLEMDYSFFDNAINEVFI